MKLKDFVRLSALFAVISVLPLNALAQVNSGYQCSVQNDTLLESNIYEFDIFLLNTDQFNTFELGTFQAGILVNPSIINGGTITANIVSGSSELVAAQQPTAISFTSNCIRLAPRGGPGQGAGTTIPRSIPGIRVVRIRLTNSVDFGPDRPDFEFNFTPLPYNTVVSAYDQVSEINEIITNSAFHTTSFMLNPILNGPLTVYNLTGGGEAPASVSLSGSQADGVNYTLLRDGMPVGQTIAGTGNAISFNNQPIGLYTITAHRAGTYMQGNMNGSVTITPACDPVTITSQPSGSSVCAGEATSFTVGVGGTAPYTYQWEFYNGSSWSSVINGSPVGAVYTNSTSGVLGVSGITQPNAYQYRCIITNCSGSNSVTTSSATLTVNPIPVITGTTSGSLCGPGAVTLGATTNAGTINWYSTATGGTSLGTGTSFNTPSLTTTTTFYVDATSNGCTTQTRTPVIATINPIPLTPVVSVTQPTCSVATGTITVTPPTDAGMTYSIDGSTYTNTTGIFTSVASGTYTVTARSPAGCTSPGTLVTVNAQPPTPVVGNQTASINSEEIFTVTPAGVPAGTTYTWTLPILTSGVTGGVAQTTPVSSISGTLSIQTGEGTAIYTVTPMTGSCIGSTFTLTVTVRSNCVPVAITSQPVNASSCAGGNASFTIAASGTTPTYQWEYLNGATWVNVTNGTPAGAVYSNATTTTLNVSGITASGSYQYRIIATNCGGITATSNAATLTVNAIPSTPVVTVTQPTCSVATGTITVTSPTGSGMTYSIDGTTYSNTTGIFTGVAPGSYRVTARSAAGCTSPESSEVIINNPPAVPTAPVIGAVTQPTCTVSTGSVGISGLPSTGTWTLTRNPGGVQTTGTGTTTTLTGIPAGTYSFIVRNADGCDSPVSGSVIINAAPPVPSLPVQTVDCSLGANLAVVTVTSPTGSGFEYRLDAGSWQTGTVFSGVANGNHTITVRNSAGCTATGPQFSVNCGCVNPPAVVLSANSGSTCGITPVTISGNTFGGSATSVTITENGGGSVTPTSAGTSPFSFTYTPVAADAGRTVTITVTTNNPLGSPCAAASATYSLTVNANPPAPTRGTVTHPTCSVSTGSVVLNNLPATGTWTITRSPGGETTTGSGTSTTISALAPGIYSFTVTNALGCTSAALANVVINPQPVTPPAPVIGTLTQPTCNTSTGSVAVSGLPSGNWSLTRTPGNVTITGNTATRNVTAVPPGTYTFTVTSAAGCVSPPSQEFTINPQPTIPDVPRIGAITHPTCDLATGSIVIENMPSIGDWVLIRYPGGVETAGSGSSVTVSSLPAGSYNFAVRNEAGCTSTASANAVINAQPPTPAAPIVGNITHPTQQVATGSVVLSGLPSSGQWTLTRNPDGSTSQGTGTTRTMTGLEPGTYTYTVTNSQGCISPPSNNIVINTRPGAPVVVITNPPTICSNETADLTLPAVTAGSDNNLTFTYWTNLEATIPYPTPEAATEGTYYIMGTTTGGYYTIRTVVVTADQMPVAYAGPDQVLDYIFNTRLEADLPEVGTGMWRLVSGTGIFGDIADPVTEVSRLSAGDNIFSWTVTNGVCEPVSDEVVIHIRSLEIPTLITPNGDSYNESFVIPGLEETLHKTELVIFDRRGLKVWESRDYQNDWNGLDNYGKELPDDTYFYVLRSESGVSLSGYIVVRR